MPPILLDQGHVLQIATILLQSATIILKKYDRYYKRRLLLQSAMILFPSPTILLQSATGQIASEIEILNWIRIRNSRGYPPLFPPPPPERLMGQPKRRGSLCRYKFLTFLLLVLSLRNETMPKEL